MKRSLTVAWPAFALFAACAAQPSAVIVVTDEAGAPGSADPGAGGGGSGTPPGPDGATPAPGADAAPAGDAAGSPRCAPGGAGRMLECSNDCAATLFDKVLLADDFGTGTAYKTTW